jgi:cytochrome c biogenesis protein CcmG, thiol:disulfide interchange protein DsbE
MSEYESTSKTAQTSSSPALRGGRLMLFGNKISLGALLAWVGVLTLLVLLALGLMLSQQGPVSRGQPIPGFTLTTFEGEEIHSSTLQGKVLVINFWASWCKPCEQEAPDLEAAWRFYQPRGDVVFLGIGYVDTEPEALAYLERFDITYPNGPDLRTRISHAFRIRGVPETFIVDQNGILAEFKKGPFLSLAEIKSTIDPLLASP